ncbi:MAG: hypothetical protein U0840_12175 [Gemmataceae bacterium]
MKNIIGIALGGGLFLAALGLNIQAMQPTSNSATPAREVGKVLVLENERTLTGDIERVGDQYRIKRLIGETWIPTSKVLKLCSSLDEAFLFLRGRANLNDTDERLRLAEWCRQHALRDRAIEEVQAASELRPQDVRIRRMLSHLRESQAKTKVSATASKTVEEEQGPRVEVSAESLGLFATKIQPILMNACVSCHTAGRGGSFQLTRVQGTGLASRRSLEKNLASVLAQMNGRDPGASKLLSKALTVHGPGMTQAPLKNRQAAAFRSLEYWVVRTAETNPHLREEAHASVIGTEGRASPRTDEKFGQDREAKGPGVPPPTATPDRSGPAVSPVPMVPMPPMPMPRLENAPPATARPDPLDPVDPEGFNREFHTQKSGGMPPEPKR